MTTNYRTRKKKLSRDKRRSAADAQDAVSPAVLRLREADVRREEREIAKLVKFNEENKKADEEIAEVKKKLTKKPATTKKAVAKKTTTKKVAKKKAVGR
jgi:hypothetical protein